MKKYTFFFSVLLVIPLLAMVKPAQQAFINRHEYVNCGNLMNVILCSERMWTNDHDDHLPSDFLSMSNELCTPKFLICPGDHNRPIASSWTTFTTNNCSYEWVTSKLSETNANRIFIRCPIHGYVGYVDGRVLDAAGNSVRPNRNW